MAIRLFVLGGRIGVTGTLRSRRASKRIAVECDTLNDGIDFAAGLETKGVNGLPRQPRSQAKAAAVKNDFHKIFVALHGSSGAPLGTKLSASKRRGLIASIEWASPRRLHRRSGRGRTSVNDRPDVLATQRRSKLARNESVYDLHALNVASGRHDLEERAVE